MNTGLVNSCGECKAICCQHGPGPYLPLEPEEYLENFSTSEAYNTKCMALDDSGRCSLWGTPKFPHVCKTHVCNQRIFTPKELENIEQVDERECPNCGCEWTLFKGKGNSWENECEICGHTIEWKGRMVKRGKKSF